MAEALLARRQGRKSFSLVAVCVLRWRCGGVCVAVGGWRAVVLRSSDGAVGGLRHLRMRTFHARARGGPGGINGSIGAHTM